MAADDKLDPTRPDVADLHDLADYVKDHVTNVQDHIAREKWHDALAFVARAECRLAQLKRALFDMEQT